MKYEQTLYKIVEPIKLNTLKRLNKSRKWKYGYNKENDIVVISKTGMIGDVIEIQGLQIALPKQPNNIYSVSDDILKQKWKQFPANPDFKKIKTVCLWFSVCTIPRGKLLLFILSTTITSISRMKF